MFEGRESLGESSGVVVGLVKGILVRDPVATFRADVMCKKDSQTDEEVIGLHSVVE